MKRRLLVVGLGLMAATTALADATMYTVKSGDSLSKIAAKFYGDVKKYSVILEANRDVISDATMIRPGQQLRIPGAAMSADQVIAEAEQQLAAAKKMNSEWKLIDKATGGSAQDLSKLLEAAKKAKASGDDAEAARIATRVKEAAMLAQQQAKDQANAMPRYTN
jgi:LysM repeat protein